jgi:hypothetical protein
MSSEKFTDPEEIKQDLKRNKSDSIVDLTNASVSLIPIVGGPLSILLGAVLPSISDRQNTWLISLSNDIQKLAEQNENFLENLITNENFITILMYATQIAIRNHQEEKLDALRNAVLNSTLESTIEDDVELMFINLLDSFTVNHLKILLLMESPEKYLIKIGKELPNRPGSLVRFIEYAFPELDSQEDVIKAVWNDLYNRTLLDTSDVNVSFSTNADWRYARTTELGNKFISFIKRPTNINE